MKSVLADIEARLDQLTDDEQITLIEKLYQRLHARTSEAVPARDLIEMAADPDIQRELRAIEQEFSVTEMDGLDDTMVADFR